MLEKTPNQAVALHHLGLLLHQKGEEQTEALPLLKKHYLLSLTTQYALNNLGKIYLDLGNWDMAANNLEKAINHKPDFDMAHNNYAKRNVIYG